MHGHLEGLSKTLSQNTLMHLFDSKPTDPHYHPISLNGGLSNTGLEVSFNVLVNEYEVFIVAVICCCLFSHGLGMALYFVAFGFIF